MKKMHGKTRNKIMRREMRIAQKNLSNKTNKKERKYSDIEAILNMEV